MPTSNFKLSISNTTSFAVTARDRGNLFRFQLESGFPHTPSSPCIHRRFSVIAHARTCLCRRLCVLELTRFYYD